MTPERWRQIEDLYHAARKCASDRARGSAGSARIRKSARASSACSRSNPAARFSTSLPPACWPTPPRTVIAPGAQLGPYKIEAQIGAGGMGTVYRAVDTRLGRVVAIKIAAERYSERFQREARAISTLNHPHICTLYDVGPNYLVMEFIEGSTLAAEIKKGPLAPEIAARYGAQIAGALAEAHALGIVHRDLKPSNIMLTRHGVKVLDFGLAKSAAPKPASPKPTPSWARPPTWRRNRWRAGSRAAPRTCSRSAWCCMKWRSGGCRFPGASLGQMLSSGSHTGRAPPSRERVGVPASSGWLVAKLLEKDPAKRPQSASEVARELSALADRLAAPPPALPVASRLCHPRGRCLLLGIAVALYLPLQGGLSSQSPIPNNPASYTQLTSFTDSAVAPVLSPDGRMLAFYRSSNPFVTPSRNLGQAASQRRAGSSDSRSAAEIQHCIFSGRRSHRLHRLPEVSPSF